VSLVASHLLCIASLGKSKCKVKDKAIPLAAKLLLLITYLSIEAAFQKTSAKLP
jgi:hypothetical protein